jgi:hypothetical protein
MFGSMLFPEVATPVTDGPVLNAPAAPTPGGALASGIDDLAFLVGGEWVASSATVTVIERVTWDATHTFLLTEVTQLVGSRPAGLARGSFGYSPTLSYLMSGANGTSGTYTGGYQSGAPDATTWVFAMVLGLGATVANVQVSMSHPDVDTLVIEQALDQNGAWVVKSSTTYARRAIAAGA